MFFESQKKYSEKDRRLSATNNNPVISNYWNETAARQFIPGKKSARDWFLKLRFRSFNYAVLINDVAMGKLCPTINRVTDLR